MIESASSAVVAFGVCPTNNVAGSPDQICNGGGSCTAVVKWNPGIIYRLTSPSGKSYVGQTIQKLSARLTGHRTCRYCRALYGAVQKYGLSNFSAETLLRGVMRKNLDALEAFAIGLCGTLCPRGYNLGHGGTGQAGTSAETRAKISKANKGRKKPPFTAEHRANISRAVRNYSPVTYAKVHAAVMKSHTDEWKKKISETMKALPTEVKSERSRAMIEARNKPGSSWLGRQKEAWAKRSPESIAEMQEASRLARQTPEFREKQSRALKAINSPERSAKLSESAKRRCTPEWKANWLLKMSEVRERKKNEAIRLAGSSCSEAV